MAAAGNNRFFCSGEQQKETYLCHGRWGRTHARWHATHNTLGGVREREERGAPSVSAFCAVAAETPSQPVGRSFSVSVAIVGFVAVTIVGADKAGQIERGGGGELQKRREAMRGRGWHPCSDRAGIVIRQPEYVHRELRLVSK